jgi:hypothetical protein
MTWGHRGSLLLRCRAFSSLSSCRFIPALSPRSPRDRLTGSASSYSPAASPRVRRSPSSWPPGQPNDSQPWSRPSLAGARRALLTGPDPPGSSRRSCFRGFHHWFLHSYASPSCLPGPSRLAVPTRPVVVGAASRPSWRLPGQAAPSFAGLLRQPNGGALSSPPGLMAPRGAPARPSSGAAPAVSRARSHAERSAP